MRQHVNIIATATALALAASFTAACVEPTEPRDLGTKVSEAACGEWGCTANSPTMGPYESHEFHTGGQINSEGLRVDGFWIGDKRYTPVVQGARLVAKAGNIVKSGNQLVNGYFRVIDADDVEFRITVKGVSNTVTYWLGDADMVQTYELKYRQMPLVDEYPVCANPPDSMDPTSDAASPAHWLRPFEAILFAGDRYNAKTKKVWATSGAAVDGWFNIGCAGSALAKLHLNRYTTAGAKGSFTTSPEARQSLLNAFVANLCGTGTPFTKPNTPLRWKDAAGLKLPFAVGVELEAVWGPTGAVCIDGPYRVPWVLPENACTPALQYCADLPGYDEDHWMNWGLVRTGIP